MSVCVGPGGIPKHAVTEARVGREGLEGDGHRFRLHGGPDRAVCVLTTDDYASLRADGVDCEPPGAFGENLLLTGEGLTTLDVGDRLAVGDGVVLEIHDVREPCGTLRSIDRRFPELMVGRSGWMCRVLAEGSVRPGDPVRRFAAERAERATTHWNPPAPDFRPILRQSPMRFPRRRLLALFAAGLATGLAACETTWGAPNNRDRHGPDDVDDYIERLESDARVESLHVARAIEALELPRDAWIGDLGCGPGVFTLPLARACPDGVVFASDIEPAQLDRLRERAVQAEIDNVVPILASYHHPHFPPGALDLLLVVDTYHHIDDRVPYMRRLRECLKDGGRLAVLEYLPGELPVGPPPEKKLAEGVLEAELAEAGWETVRRFDTHPHHDFLLLRPTLERSSAARGW